MCFGFLFSDKLLGTVLLKDSRSFKSRTTGENTDAESNLHYPSTFFGVYHINEKASMGLGIFSPFGLKSEWPSDWEGRYITTSSELKTFNFNPNIAYKFADNFNVSVGVDLLYGDAELNQNINFSQLGFSDGYQSFKGDAFGYGFNVGLLYQVSDDLSLGASYRSKISLNLDGKSEFTFPQGTPGFLQANLPNTSGEVSIDLPPQLDLGLAYKFTSELIMEVGCKWEGWSTYKDLTFQFTQPINGATSVTQPKNWEDSWSFNIGAKYDFSPTYSVVGGYFHAWSAIPDETIEPSVIGADRNSFSIGLIKSFKRLEVAVSYAVEILEDRTKNNIVGLETGSAANGEYSQTIHMLGLSLSYSF